MNLKENNEKKWYLMIFIKIVKVKEFILYIVFIKGKEVLLSFVEYKR